MYLDLWVGSPNFWPGRQNLVTPFGTAPIGMVFHVSIGGRVGVQSWFQDPTSNASAQKLVCKDGDRLVFVADEDTAWTHGDVDGPNTDDPIIAYLVDNGINPNRALIGIETERLSHTERLTPEQLESCCEEAMRLHRKFGWPRDGSRIFGHDEINSVDRAYCPRFSRGEWDAIVAAVAADEHAGRGRRRRAPAPGRRGATGAATASGQNGRKRRWLWTAQPPPPRWPASSCRRWWPI